MLFQARDFKVYECYNWQMLRNLVFSPASYVAFIHRSDVWHSAKLHGLCNYKCTKFLTVLAELMMDDPTDTMRSYEAGIFARLEGVKAAYDPSNLFRDLQYMHPQVINPK